MRRRLSVMVLIPFLNGAHQDLATTGEDKTMCEPITMIILAAKALGAAAAHTAAAHGAVHAAAAGAAHTATAAKGAAVLSHSAPAVHALVNSTVATAHTQGVLPAAKQAAEVLVATGTVVGLALGAKEMIDGARSGNGKQAATGAARTAMNAHGLGHLGA